MSKNRGSHGLHRPGDTGRWWFDFTIQGKRFRGSTGLSDRRAAEEEARKMKAREERRAAGLLPETDAHAARPIEEHIVAFEAVLDGRVSRAQRAGVTAWLRRYVAHANARTLADLDPAKVAAWLSRERGRASGGNWACGPWRFATAPCMPLRSGSSEPGGCTGTSSPATPAAPRARRT